MFVPASNKSSSSNQRKRQWLLKRLWSTLFGDSSGTSPVSRRLGMLESLEERRVLATMFAVNDSNQLWTFDSATPGTISNSVAITGLVAGENVVGIDTRPATGQLYAFGLVGNGTTGTGRIYTLDPNTGVATQVGNAPWSTTLIDTQFVGFNFNPNVDRIRITNREGENFRVHPDTGALVSVDTNLNSTGINGVSYTNNDGALTTTTLYGLNFTEDLLVTIGGLNGTPSPNTGVVNNIGGTGIVSNDVYGLEITTLGGTTTAYATSDGRLYTVNLTTGLLTAVGAIGGGGNAIMGLTAALNTINVAGSNADDVVVVDATGPSSGSYSLNGGPAIPFANIASFSFLAAGGNDTLTINNPAGGLFAPAQGITYHGGGQAGDNLQLLGGGSAAFAQTYFVGTTTPPIGAGPGSNADGLIRFTGATPVDIRFTGLAPIIDNVLAASLTVVSTDAANSISVTNGTASRLLVAVDAFESIEFSNKSQLIINAGDGVAGGDAADNVLLNFTNLPAGLAGITINAEDGADTVSVQASSGVPVTLNGGDGLDIINVGNTGTLGTPGLLTPVAGPVAVNGGADGASLTVDGTGAAVAADYTITATTVTRTSPAGFGGVAYSNLSSLLLTVGAGANVISVNSTAPTVVTNIATGAGNDSIVFANGVSLNGGLVNGGADTDTLDYSAYTTGVSANLGLTVSGLAATLAGDQEVPPNSSTASGTATITNYNLVTKTFDISVTVTDLNPASVTGFHIHRGAFGVNGPIIVDFSSGPLVPAGTGFTFNAVGVSLNAANMQDEAALLSGLTYLNVHTAAFPGGIIRGQLFSNGNVALSSGIATGTAGVFGIENTIGGSGADGLVGSTAGNSLQGNAGNDVLLGGPGSDNMQGGNDNDNLVWSNGDGTDVIDGNGGTDIVSVNGAVAAGDVFTVTGTGSRVAFARTNFGPFGLDIGTAERLIVNGAGGDDSITSSDMSGVADLTTLDLNGQVGNDTFNAAFPAPAGLTVNIKGGPHGAGDTLVVDAAGGPLTDTGSQLSKPGANPINYIQVESLTINNIGDLVITGSGANDNLVVNATSANSGTYQLNGGPVIAFTGMTKLTFNSAAGSDGLTINNPAVGLFAPVGGIDYNGGGQAGDLLNLLGGGAADLVQTYFVGTTTPPIGVGPGNSGDGLLRFTGSSNLDLRFTGLAPIVDTVLAASLTVNSTDAANNISLTNGVAPRLVVAVDAFETLEFNNKAQLTINAGDGVGGGDAADNILLNFTNLPAGLTSVTINGNEGTDAINLQASSNIPVTLNGGDDLDVINIGNNGTLGVPGLLTPVVGPVFVNGGTGGADLTVDGTGAAVAADYSITATTVTRSLPAGFGGVTYSNLNSLLLATGSGPNVVTVSSTSVPTTADANGGTDTLILNPPNSISVFEQAGNYVFDLGFPGGLTALDFENINLQPGNGGLNIVGDEGQDTAAGGAGVNDTDVVEVVGTAPGAGGLRLNNIAVPQVVLFTGVTNLNVNTFDLDDDVTIDPFATTTQSWDIVVNVNSGSGDDDILYGNSNAVPALDLIANGSVAGVSENVTVTPAIVIGAGEIAVPGVVTIHYQETEDLSFLLNDGTAGDTDSLTVRGLDSNLPDSFTIRPDAAGNDAEPVVDIDTNAVQLLQIENVAAVAPGGAQFFVTVINFEGLAGDDTFNVLPAASGTVLNIDGGAPTFNPLSVDRVVIDAPANPANQVSIQAGATSDSGSIVANLAGALRAPINFSRVEGITVNNSGAAGVVGNNGNNQITVAGTGASAFTATVDGGPTLQFNAVTSLQINALDGSDDIALTVGLLALTSINVNGGAPTASDKLVVVGTPAVDTVVFTPTSASAGSLTGLASPVNFTTTEHVVYDGNDIAALDNLTINGPLTNNTFTYDASLLKGSFSSFLSPEFESLRTARITVNGGPSNDLVNLIGSAGVDTVTSAANAITFITPGSAAIITLGANIDSLAVSTLAGFDNVNLVGVLAPITTTVLGGEGDDTLVGSPQNDLIYGGDGNDVIIGGAGIDVGYGEAGNDRFGDPAVADPAANDAGNDLFYGGDGSDTLTWDPGDGSDLFEGGAGTDVMVFNGSAGVEAFTFNAVGARLEFLRSLGAIDMDLAEVEQVNLNALGGADRTTINDLSSTAVRVINVSLGLDAATDAVIVQGRSVDDNLIITRPGATSLAIVGLPYDVVVDTGEPTDTLTVNANAGDDQVTAAPGTEAVMAITLGGGLGDDVLTGNVMNLFGDEGNDLLVGGAGNQLFDGGAGDDTFVGNGGTDNVGGGAGNSIGDSILLPGTVGADTFNLSLTATGQLIATANGVTTTYSDFIGGPIATSGIEQIAVSGSAGDDTLTVDSTSGAIPIPINYDGGNNADLLTLTGGTATENTYAVGPSVTEGTSTIVIGGVTQIVRFNALEPVIDLVAGPLVVVATNADNSINYTQGNVVANGLVSIDGFETIEFSNKVTLTIDSLAGADKVHINNPTTPTGLTTITVAGGDPTASDELLVSGTAATEAINVTPTGVDAATIIGLAGVTINATTTESIKINGLGGDDTLTLTATAGNDTIVIDHGANADSGTVAVNSLVPVAFLGLGAAGTLAIGDTGGQDRLIINGASGNDNFVVNAGGDGIIAYQSDVASSVGGTTHIRTTVTNAIEALLLNGFDGDDNFIINPTAFFPAGVAINAGNPSSGSDRVTINGTAGVDSYTLQMQASGDSLAGAVGGPVVLNNVEDLVFSTGGGDDSLQVLGMGGQTGLKQINYFSGNDAGDSLQVIGTANVDAFNVTPQSPTTATVTANGSGTSLLASLGAALTSTLTISGAAGADTVLVGGTGAADVIAIVKGATTTVGVGANKLVSISAANTENVTVDAGDGNDTINVSGTAANGQVLSILGGSPTSNAGAAADILNVTLATAGTTAAVPGASPDAGVITNPDGAINYAGIEFFNVTGAAGANTFNIQGTHDNDTLALQFLGGANRVWVNDRAVYTFANYATVNMNGLFGDDKINVLPIGLVGVTTISVAGGDPTASDELVVSGSVGNDAIDYAVSNTVGAGAVTIAGSATVNFTTTESLVIDGLGGTDNLTVTSPSGHRTTVTPGANADSGAIVSQGFGAGTGSVPLTYAHIGALGTITLAGQGDIVEFNGTANSDTFNITGTTIQVTNATAGFVTNLFTLNNVFSLEARGLDGDDLFQVSGTLAALTGGVIIDGGNPSASDVINLSGAIGAVGITLADPSIGSDTTVSGYGAPVTLIGVEVANLSANNNAVTVQGTSQSDSLVYTPTSATSATFTNAGLNTLFNLLSATSSTIDLAAGNDTLTVRGTTEGEAITVNVPAGTMNTGAFGGVVNFVAGGIEALSVLALQGADTITVTPGAVPVFIDGGDPIGILPGDQLIVNAAVGFFPGPENDEGGVTTAGEDVSFDHIESLTVAAIPGCPFLILGTNGDDDITIIARDASTTAGADGVQDMTFSVNAGMNVVLLNAADVYVDAMAGDDDIVVRAVAPNEAAWDVNLRVAGGSPSIGAAPEADRLVVETPNGAGGLDDVIFNPTGFDTGNLVLDENANGTYDAAGTDSLITFGSFIFDCPPAAFTYTSSAGGVELVELNGEGAPAIDDNITINGTAADDATVVNPTNAGSGTFASTASPLFIFKSFDALTVNPGAGGFDLVEINGTVGPDTVTSNANTVTLGGTVTLGAGMDQLNINTFDGNDNIDLDLALTGLKKVIDAGAGNDSVNLLGVAIDPADPVIYGGDGDDVIIGSPNIDLIFGGRGNDILIGAGNNDQLFGEDGNDTFGNASAVGNGVADDAGNDQFHGGAGSDTIVWEPGDGSDIIEGGAGESDVLVFFGGAGAETFNVFAKLSDPTRAILFRNTGNITMDMAGVDQINLQGNAGADSYVVGRANNGDSGSVTAPTAPYTDPTASLSDLSTTELRVINITEAADAADNVFIDGRTIDDNVTVSVESAATSVLRVAGLPYDVRIIGADTADRLTIRGNEGNDTIKTINPTGAGALNVEAIVGITLAGGGGNDSLSADAILIGGIGNDSLEGGAGDDQLFGNEGDDTMWGGAGADSFDGGSGFDTILVRGGAGNDVIDISQTAATSLTHVVNGDSQTDTLVLNANTRTVERVYVDSSAGVDTIRVQWADSLGVDANVNSLRVDVDGGEGNTGDRLGVVDLGTGDLILFERGTTDDSGTMTVGPGNAEPLIATFVNVEVAQPIAGNGGDVVVFKHDPFEFNNARTLATHLGANSAINVDPTINPGVDPNFGFPADEDWYRVVAETTGVLDFQVYFRQVGTLASGRPGLPNAGNLDIQVTDAAGNVINGFGTNDATTDERVRIPAVAGQTYYLRVFANGTAINNYNITVDNYAPPTPANIELLDNPVTQDPPLASNSDTGRSQFDNITRDNTPTLVFRLDDAIFLQDLPGNNVAGSPPDEVIPIPFQAAAGTAGYRIAIFDEGSSPAPGTQVGTPPQDPIGFATFVSPGVYQFTTPALSDGTHFLTARVQMVDPATAQQTGWGARSEALEVIVDTVVPPAFFGNSTSATDGLLQSSDSGIATVIPSFADRITNDVTPTMYGSAEANAIMRLYVDRTNNGFSADDILLGHTVARALDGTNQSLGEWEITPTTGLNSPELVAAIGKDGVRRLFVTAEDVAGNISAPQTLDIMIDTTSPIISSVTYPNGDSIFQQKPLLRPTPVVTSLFVTFTGGPVSAGGFNLVAVDTGLATDTGNYQLVGDHNGNILITNAAVVSQSDTTVIVRLDFSAPLPDDRFTLTLDDSISDAAQNFLDGDSQAQSPGTAVNVLPSGNGIAGGDFIARFTVDSRPEIGAVSEGLVYVDINGNMLWDPTGKDNDKTNRDFVFQFGQLVDAHFAGNFAPTGAVVASGFDKLGAYGRFAGVYSFILDTNDDGVGDFTSVMPAAYQVNGNPVAGNFNAAHPGDEIGLFDGTFWYLDVNGNNQIDVGERFASNFNGIPVVGDFNGDGSDDLAAYNNATNQFIFDTNRDGLANFTWNVADDVNRFVGLSGFTDRPVAGDLNLDGIDDIGLWVKDRQGTLPRDTGEYFFWLSDRVAANPADVFDAYSPDPLGNDLFAQFGDELALPIFGNFDPPVDNNTLEENILQRLPDPLDINGDGFVTAIDALLAINVLNTYPNIPANSPVRAYFTIGQVKADTNGDRTVSAIDALLVINELNRRAAGGEGEVDSRAAYSSAADSFFEELGDEVAKKRRVR